MGMAYVAGMSGYQRQSLYAALARGWMSQDMATRLSHVFRDCVIHLDGQVIFPNVVPSPRGPRPRPGPRWPCGKLRPRAG